MIYSFIDLFIYSFIDLFIYLFIYLFLSLLFLSTTIDQGNAYEMTKFDTDDVKKYPIFSIDLYNCQIPIKHEELSKHLESAVLSAFPSKKSKEVEKGRETGTETESVNKVKTELSVTNEVENIDFIPDLQAMHLLKSTDKLSCIVLAAWTGKRCTYVTFVINEYII